MLLLVNSTVEDVSRKVDVGYDAVESAIERCIQVRVDWNQIAELEIIGIDEIAMKKVIGTLLRSSLLNNQMGE